MVFLFKFASKNLRLDYILLTIDNVKSTRRALELMEMLGGKEV